MSIPSYISIPSSASPIPQPSRLSSPNHAAATAIATSSSSAQAVAAPLERLSSFPPSTSQTQNQNQNQNQNQQSRKFTVPSTSSITSNVSDMLLSSLLPSNLPRLPGGLKGNGSGPGVPRELSTRKEALSLPLVSNNFRRFVTKVSAVSAIDLRSHLGNPSSFGLRRGF